MSKASDQLATLVAQFAEDHNKFQEKKNASAGTRARKTLQEIRNLCATTRGEIQQERN